MFARWSWLHGVFQTPFEGGDRPVDAEAAREDLERWLID